MGRSFQPAAWPAVVSLAIVSATPPLQAEQANPSALTSNRPGIAESEALVGPGTLQVEAGVQASESPLGAEEQQEITWGELAVRAGVTPRVEVFAGWDGLSLDRIQTNGESHIEAGGNDLRIGVKLALLDEDRHGLTLTLSPTWSFPIGDERFGSGSEDWSLRVMWARTLPHDWSVSGNVMFNRTTDDLGRYWDNGVMLGVARALTPGFSLFGEGVMVLLADKPDVWTVDAGWAWVTSPNVQWDVSAGHSFHHRGDPWFVSGGLTLRRPRRTRVRPLAAGARCRASGCG